MGEARRRKLLGLPPRNPKPSPGEHVEVGELTDVEIREVGRPVVRHPRARLFAMQLTTAAMMATAKERR